jgi:DNA repair exonuclease SbcCD ATPase subunit
MDAAGYLYGTEDRIKKITNSIDRAEITISEITTKIAKLQGELGGIAEAEAQLQKANEEKFRIQADIADWTYIRNACGKNGLQAMEIDGAAPIITGFANDLLSQAFGSLYTVKFQTQDENGKECLDIITITDDGEEVLLENLSGGQKVWILMALRLAMTLLSKEKSGRNFQTSFFDELDGALDSENAVNFISMYRAFMEIGHFEAIPFISHKQECRSMADHVLMFEPGKNPYWC